MCTEPLLCSTGLPYLANPHNHPVIQQDWTPILQTRKRRLWEAEEFVQDPTASMW